jgi:hypothetical protein
MRVAVLAVSLLAAAGCAGAARHPGAPATARAAGVRAAAFDSAQARRLCANADSVIVAGRACELRDQGAPFRLLP